MSDTPTDLTLPTFIIAGAAKCGTTSLWAYLNQHPDVYMSPRKELHFFDDDGEYAKGMAYYASAFAGHGRQPAIGEASPNYLNCFGVARRIKDNLPDVRLIFIFRDPVKRAYSNYWHAHAKGRPMPPFEKAITDDRFPAIGAKSRYAPYLQPFFDLFPRERILCLLTEQLGAEPEAVLPRLFEHAGADPVFRPAQATKRHNPYKAPRFRTLQRVASAMGPIHTSNARDPETGLFLFKRKRKAFPELRRNVTIGLSKMNKRVSTYPPLDPGVASRIGETFREDNQRFAEMTGLDIEKWWASA